MSEATPGNAFYPPLHRYLMARMSESSQIPADRRKALERISAFIAERVTSGATSRLTFICTQNSRRSQMAQIWAQATARFLGVPGVSAFSGGTEATAFDPRAVSAMIRAGFRIERHAKDDNPVYLVHAGDDLPPVRAFSKAYLDPSNPTEGFCAVMTCSRADRECPVITSADERVLIPYEDPKTFDGTEQESVRYDTTCREICREMGWLFARTRTASGWA